MFLKLVQMATKCLVGSSFEANPVDVANDFISKRSESAAVLDKEQSSALIQYGPSVTSRNGSVTPELPTSPTDTASFDPEMSQGTSHRGTFEEDVSNEFAKGPY
jgi:hypothetical protein